MLYKVLKIIGLILLLIIVLGFIYEQYNRFVFNQKSPSTDEYVTLEDGRKLHFHKEGDGSATVIFESGLGGDHAHWQDIQPAVAQNATTISYDRAGILWSDKSAEKSLGKMASDLEYLLEKTKCPKPYILVGHSFGGVTLRKFIHDNASDIAGIVFIDVSHPLQKERFSPELMKTQKVPPQWAMAFLNEIGVLRLLFTLKPFSTDVPRDHWFNENVHQYSHRIFPGVMREAASDDKLNKEALSYDDFGDIPLRIITATYPSGMDILTPELMEEYRNGHFANQKELLGLSTQSAQIWAKNSGHYVTLQEPELVITCIERLLRLEKSK